MKEVRKEKDYLQRLLNVRENTYEYIKQQNIKQSSVEGETFTELLVLLEEEIQGITFVRQF